MKVSDTKYVLIKRDNLYGTPCVPTGAVRETDGKKEAQFICFMRRDSERDVWAERGDILKK